MRALAARRAGIALSLPGVFAVVGGLASTAAAAAPAAQLEPFQASYSWSWKGATVAESTLKLEHGEGDSWIYSSTSEPRGLGHLYPMRPKLRSSLRVTDAGCAAAELQGRGRR